MTLADVRAMLARIPGGQGYEDRVDAAVLEAVRSAVAEEREACALVAETRASETRGIRDKMMALSDFGRGQLSESVTIAERIRARKVE